MIQHTGMGVRGPIVAGSAPIPHPSGRELIPRRLPRGVITAMQGYSGWAIVQALAVSRPTCGGNQPLEPGAGAQIDIQLTEGNVNIVFFRTGDLFPLNFIDGHIAVISSRNVKYAVRVKHAIN